MILMPQCDSCLFLPWQQTHLYFTSASEMKMNHRRKPNLKLAACSHVNLEDNSTIIWFPQAIKASVTLE